MNIYIQIHTCTLHLHSVTNMQATIATNPTNKLSTNYCVGKGNYSLASTTNWFGFVYRPITRDTRCQYCAAHLKMLGEQNLYGLATHSAEIDCDSITDMTIAGMEHKGFSFGVRSPNGRTPFLVHPEKAAARHQGVLVVEMPEIQDYCVEINPQRNAFDSDKYYTFEMSVGDRAVVINDGRPIYYNGVTKVSGFTTGTNDSFKFVAEKKRAEFAGATGINDPNTNLITIRIQTFRRERQYVCPRELQTLRPAFQTDRPYRDFSAFGEHPFGAEPHPERESEQLPTTNNSTSFGDRIYVSRKLFGRQGVSDEAVPAATPAATGGSTISGMQHVNDVSTTTTTDRFVPTSSFAVTIQLVHVDDTRYQKTLVADHIRYATEEDERLRNSARVEQDRILERQRALLLSTEQKNTQQEHQHSPLIPLEPTQPGDVAQPDPRPHACPCPVDPTVPFKCTCYDSTQPVQPAQTESTDLDGFVPIGSS